MVWCPFWCPRQGVSAQVGLVKKLTQRFGELARKYFVGIRKNVGATRDPSNSHAGDAGFIKRPETLHRSVGSVNPMR